MPILPGAMLIATPTTLATTVPSPVVIGVPGPMSRLCALAVFSICELVVAVADRLEVERAVGRDVAAHRDVDVLAAFATRDARQAAARHGRAGRAEQAGDGQQAKDLAHEGTPGSPPARRRRVRRSVVASGVRYRPMGPRGLPGGGDRSCRPRRAWPARRRAARRSRPRRRRGRTAGGLDLGPHAAGLEVAGGRVGAPSRRRSPCRGPAARACL